MGDIIQALEGHDYLAVQHLTNGLHAADKAELIGSLDPSLRKPYLEATKSSFEPEILAYLDDSLKQEVLEEVGPHAFAAAVSDLDSDDAFSVIEDMSAAQQREILEAISAEERAVLEEGLNYPPDSAGRLMQHEVACVPTFWATQEVINYLKDSSHLPEDIYSVYTVDPQHRPVGIVSISKLLRQHSDAPIASVMDTIFTLIPVSMDQEEVAHLFRHYGLVSAPVIDEKGRLVGIITVDDIVEVIEEEAEEDIMHLAGISESDFHEPPLRTSYRRAQWLTVTVINTLIAASVISQFLDSIRQKVALSFLMGIVAAMAGNAGMQTTTVTVRALATRELRPGNIMRAIIKELFVGTVTGTFFALILGCITALWLQDTGIGIVLGGALLANMLWAAFAGTCLPLIVQRIGMDPAISAGPLLTTTTDILGYAIFLGLATYFLM
jgi:magnesium transporter